MTISQPEDIDAVHFINSKVGWASEDNYTRLLITTDGGTLWRVLAPRVAAQEARPDYRACWGNVRQLLRLLGYR